MFRNNYNSSFFYPPLAFSFFPPSFVYLVPSFNLCSICCFCHGFGRTGQGQENDNIHSFSAQIRRAATCTQAHAHIRTDVCEHAAMMDERSHTWGVNMIHGSFVGISPPHRHTHVLTHSQLYFISENALFCQHVSLWCQLIPPLALHSQQKPTTLFECQQQQKEHGACYTLPPVSRGRWKRFKEVCLYTDTRPAAQTLPDRDVRRLW